MVSYLVSKSVVTLLETIAGIVKAIFTWLVYLIDCDSFTPSMTQFTKLVSKSFGHAGGEEWYAAIIQGLTIAGLSITVFLFFFNILKLGFGNVVECKDTLPQLCVRLVISLLLVITLASTMETIQTFFREEIYSPAWKKVNEGLTASGGGAMDGAIESAFSSGIAGEFIAKDGDVFDKITDLAFKGFNPSYNASEFGKMISAILSIIFVFTIGYQILKLAFEMIRRYMVTIFLIIISPLTASTLISSSTQIIFGAYCNMFFGQLILLLVTRIWVKASITMWYHVSLGDLRQTFMILAWILIGVKFENYMKTLRMDAPMTGGALLDSIAMGAGATVIGITRMARSTGGMLQKAGAAADSQGMVKAGNFILGKGTDPKSTLQTAASLPMGADHRNGISNSLRNNMTEAYKRGQLGDLQSKGMFATHLAGMNANDKQAMLRDIVNGQYGDAMFGPNGRLNSDSMFGPNGSLGTDYPNLKNLDYQPNGNISGIAEMPIGLNSDDSIKTVDIPFTLGNNLSGDDAISIGDGAAAIKFDSNNALREPGYSFGSTYNGDGRLSAAEIATGTNVSAVVSGSPMKDQIPEGSQILTKINDHGGADYYLSDASGNTGTHIASSQKAGDPVTYRGDVDKLYAACSSSVGTSFNSPEELAAAQVNDAKAINYAMNDLGLHSISSISKSADHLEVQGKTINGEDSNIKIYNALNNNPSVKGRMVSTQYGDFKVANYRPESIKEPISKPGEREVSFIGQQSDTPQKNRGNGRRNSEQKGIPRSTTKDQKKAPGQKKGKNEPNNNP